MTAENLKRGNELAREIRHIAQLLKGFNHSIDDDDDDDDEEEENGFKVSMIGSFSIIDDKHEGNPILIERSSEEGKLIIDILKRKLEQDVLELDKL